MNTNYYSSLVKKTLSLLPYLDPFIENFLHINQIYAENSRNNKSIREIFPFWAECSTEKIKAERLLDFSENMIAELASALSKIDAFLLTLDRSHNSFKSKLKTYTTIWNYLKENPCVNMMQLKYDIYRINPDWDDDLEASTTEIIENISYGYSDLSTLISNVKDIREVLSYESDVKPYYKKEVLQQIRYNYTRQKERMEILLPLLKERASELKNEIENSHV